MSQDRYNYVPLEGQTLAGAKVQNRAPNVNGNARFRCTLACGCDAIFEGIKLRAAEKAGKTLLCKNHRPKRPGTVQRRTT